MNKDIIDDRKKIKILTPKNIAIGSISTVLAASLSYTGFCTNWGWRTLHQAEQTLTGSTSLKGAQYIGEMDWGILEGQGELQIDSGVTLRGKWNNGQLQGEGVSEYRNVGTYDGEFYDSQRSGNGTFTWINGDVYTGEWSNDTMNGKGTYTWANGDIYTGDFLNGKADGEGTLCFTSGEKYEGSFVNGEYEGNGIFDYPSIGIYKGSFVNSKREGDGTFTWKDGTTYTGMWRKDYINGKGVITAENSEPLEGDFKDGILYTGSFQATNETVEYDIELSLGNIVNSQLLFEDGSLYTGSLLGDNLSGKGKYTSSNGTIYDGEIQNGKLVNGKLIYTGENVHGTIEYKNGYISFLDVEWTNGDVFKSFKGNVQTGKIADGNVTIEYLNGDRYEGEIKNGLKHGKGKYYWAIGASYDGNWENDKFSGYGTYCFANQNVAQSVYGKFFNGKLNGTYTLTASNGNTYSSMWKDNTCTYVFFKY